MSIGRHARQSRRPTARSAFTLVELIVAMAVIGIVVVALYGGITTGYSSVRLARENLRATQILVEKMEAIRLYDWEQLTTPSFVASSFSVPYDPADTTNTTKVIYSGQVSITPVSLPASYTNDMRLVTVQLTWNTAGLPRTRQLSTYVCRTGLQNYLY